LTPDALARFKCIGMSGGGKTVTRLLRDWRGGDHAALDELMPMVYAELHKLAAAYLRREQPGHTFRPTDLVSEAYLRLAEGGPVELSDRVHFYAIAARVMRQILVDSARRRAASKRGSGERPVTLEEAIASDQHPEDLVALDEALTALAKLDERKARTVELFYFAGLTQDEVALALEVHVNTVQRDLRFAEAWINKHLEA
jgi:RNA polymerase sigma-70 factor, ECF subfamily